jgi:hypothetical protein
MWSVDEPPYTLIEVARLLGVHRNTAWRLFQGEEGVLVISRTRRTAENAEDSTSRFQQRIELDKPTEDSMTFLSH